MKAKKFTPAMRGLAALMTCLMVLSIVGTGVANTYRGALDDTLGTESYVTINDDSAARFKTDYATIEDMAAAARDIAIREGEEGTVVMKNDNGVLPLKANANVALFGLAAYNVYGPKGGNADAASLADALAGAGLNVNETLKDYYLTNIINMHTEMRANRWTGKEVPTTVYDHLPDCGSSADGVRGAGRAGKLEGSYRQGQHRHLRVCARRRRGQYLQAGLCAQLRG